MDEKSIWHSFLYGSLKYRTQILGSNVCTLRNGIITEPRAIHAPYVAVFLSVCISNNHLWPMIVGST